MSDQQPANPPPPTVDTSGVREIASGVWVIPDHRVPLVPNIGIVLGSDAALVVDTGMGRENGQSVLATAKRLAGDRKLMLTLTHFHPEHGYGAEPFKGNADIIYNREQATELADKGEAYLGMFRGMGRRWRMRSKARGWSRPTSSMTGTSTKSISADARSCSPIGAKRIRAATRSSFLPGEGVAVHRRSRRGEDLSDLPVVSAEDADIDGGQLDQGAGRLPGAQAARSSFPAMARSAAPRSSKGVRDYIADLGERVAGSSQDRQGRQTRSLPSSRPKSAPSIRTGIFRSGSISPSATMPPLPRRCDRTEMPA